MIFDGCREDWEADEPPSRPPLWRVLLLAAAVAILCSVEGASASASASASALTDWALILPGEAIRTCWWLSDIPRDMVIVCARAP